MRKHPQKPGLGQRLMELRTSRGMGLIEFSTSLGVPQSSIWSWEKGTRPITIAGLLKIAAKAPPEERSFWLEAAGINPAPVKAPPTKPEKPNRYVEIPLVSGFAGAGPGYWIEDDNIEEMLRLPRSISPNASDTACIRVAGNSMEPTITKGSIAAVDMSQRRIVKLNGKVVAVRHGVEGLKFKRLKRHEGKNMLLADNPLYAPLDLAAGWEIIGRVVWFIQSA